MPKHYVAPGKKGPCGLFAPINRGHFLPTILVWLRARAGDDHPRSPVEQVSLIWSNPTFIFLCTFIRRIVLKNCGETLMRCPTCPMRQRNFGPGLRRGNIFMNWWRKSAFLASWKEDIWIVVMTHRHGVKICICVIHKMHIYITQLRFRFVGWKYNQAYVTKRVWFSD